MLLGPLLPLLGLAARHFRLRCFLFFTGGCLAPPRELIQAAFCLAAFGVGCSWLEAPGHRGPEDPCRLHHIIAARRWCPYYNMHAVCVSERLHDTLPRCLGLFAHHRCLMAVQSNVTESLGRQYGDIGSEELMIQRRDKPSIMHSVPYAQYGSCL
jgi:hypothetical protein